MREIVPAGCAVINIWEEYRIHTLIFWYKNCWGNYISDNKGRCEVFPAPFAVFLNADENTYVEPDISVICDKHKLNEHGCIGAPDFIIEVVSPSGVRIFSRT